MEQEALGQDRLMTISEVSDLLGISSSALRYYERVGLLSPCRDERSNYRGYSQKEVFQLSDIVLYRNAGVGVKDIEHLVNEPIAKTLEVLDGETERKLGEIEELRLSLLAIARFSRRVRRYLALKTMSWRIVDRPTIKRLSEFDLMSRIAFERYLRQGDGLRYGAYFPNATEPKKFVDASVDVDEELSGEVLWEIPLGCDGECRFVNFLLTTDYGATDRNDLPQAMARFEAEGISCGSVVAEYLTFDVDAASGRRVDCYEAWAQVVNGRCDL